jgi:hypothetical protein
MVETLRNLGNVTLEEFQNGFTYTITATRPMDDAGRKQVNTERAEKLKSAVNETDRDAINEIYDALLQEDAYTTEVEQQFAAMPELTKDSPEWLGLQQMRDTILEAALDELLANYRSVVAERDNLKRVIEQSIGRPMTPQDVEFVQRVEDRAREIQNENSYISAQGDFIIDPTSNDSYFEFLKAFNEAIIGRDTDRHAPFAELFPADERASIISDLEAFKTDSKLPDAVGQERFAVQHAVANLAMFETQRQNADLKAKRTIARSYVPFGREGPWQGRVQAIDPKTGEIYKVSERFRHSLVYIQAPTKADAEFAVQRINSVLGKDTYEMEVLVKGEYEIKPVLLVARAETARTTSSSASSINLNEVLSTILRFNVNLTPAERSRLVVGMTKQNAPIRNRLERAGVPGFDPNTLKYVSQHLESLASSVARREHRIQLDNLFDETIPESTALWYGNLQTYEEKRQAWENAQNDQTLSDREREVIKRDFDDYHFTYVTNNSQVRGKRYLDRGRRAVAFLDSQDSIEYSDFASGELGSSLKMWTVISQLGGSVATGMLNIIGVQTNAIPALATYNAKTSFGGGFGLARSQIAVTHALSQVANPRQARVEYWDSLLSDPQALAESGFTLQEAQFMQKEVGGGTMAAALMNALLGSARGKVTSGAGQKALRAYMAPFAYTEQMSRRGVGLASFRLRYEQEIQALENRSDLTQEQKQEIAFDKADRFAVDMIDNTLGEYAMFNRPALFRGGMQQFIFMYKMFPITSILVMKNMSRKGQLTMIGLLLLLGGTKALPFADDLMDLIDTIAQALGLGPRSFWKGSAERTLVEAVDSVMPGAAPYALRGFVNNFLPTNLSDRVSLGNIVPGTGIALAGSNTTRELLEVAGPVASFIQSSISTAGDLARYGLGKAGVVPDTTSFMSVVRNSPFTMGRVLGDLSMYSDANAVVNLRGQVITKDIGTSTYIARALGYYPSAATRENDVVRVSRRVNDYAKDITALYRGLYVSARLANDNKRANEVLTMVREWNNNAKGTGMEIRNFPRNANRALREARRSTTERYLRTTPKASRQMTNDLLRIYGVDE